MFLKNQTKTMEHAPRLLPNLYRNKKPNWLGSVSFENWRQKVCFEYWNIFKGYFRAEIFDKKVWTLIFISCNDGTGTKDCPDTGWPYKLSTAVWPEHIQDQVTSMIEGLGLVTCDLNTYKIRSQVGIHIT